MSYGPPVNTPKVSSQDQYRYNKEQVEMAKRALEQFESMNENAWRQHREEELARKISEGERARSVVFDVMNLYETIDARKGGTGKAESVKFLIQILLSSADVELVL